LLIMLNRRMPGWRRRSARSRSAKARWCSAPSARPGHRRPEGHQPGPLKNDSVAPDLARDHVGLPRAGNPTRVAYLGPAGTFSEEAALGYFGSSIVRVPCASFDEVFRTTTAGAADFGVVPVENSTEGGVARTLDLFLPPRCSSSARPACSCATTCCARPTTWKASPWWRTRRRWRNARAGSATTCPSAERRPVSSNAEGARLAALDERLAAIAR
jgi:chorismate mutase/prephenate dehydratase